MTFWSRWRDLLRGRRADSAQTPGLEEPVEEVPERTISPLAAPVHVQSGSALVRVDNGVIVVEREGEPPFETIRHSQLMSDLAIWIDDERILRLVLRWLRTFGWRWRGVAQGAPISPLLANLYLHPFDRLMTAAGWRTVRYADDFVVLAAGAAEAARALADARRLLRARGLALNMAKTRIVPPGESFRFLGRTLSSAAPAPTAGP